MDTHLRRTLFRPADQYGDLTEETGEVARVMARAPTVSRVPKLSDHIDLADELADLLWVLTCIANQCGVNLQEALEKNLEEDKDANPTFKQ